MIYREHIHSPPLTLPTSLLHVPPSPSLKLIESSFHWLTTSEHGTWPRI